MILKNASKALPLLLIAACNGQKEAYYDGAGQAPSISGFAEGDEIEYGNVGGQEVTLTGSNFGEDPNSVVVYFGSLNAEILSVSDSEMTIRTPRGPIQGGAVDIAVATPTGVAEAADAYTYEMGALYHENEVGYIVATNYWNSCYGGADDLDVGCDTITYTGFSGLEASSEFFQFAFPRIHTPSVGYFAGIDVSSDEWALETPGQVSFPYLSFVIDDLRFNVDDSETEDGSNFMLQNTSTWEGEEWCSDLSSQVSWDYIGGPGMAPGSVVPGSGSILEEASASSCCDPSVDDCAPEDNLIFPMDTMQFCETLDFGEAHTYEYAAAWPIGKNFFAGTTANNGARKAAKVDLTLESAGIDSERLKLPKPIIVEAAEGFENLGDIPNLWSVGGGMNGCFDDDGDGNTTLDETALRFEWEPADLDNLSEVDDTILSANTYVRVSLTYLSMGWLGGEGYPMRASITVKDKNNYDKDTGKSSVELPTEILYQMPFASAEWGGEGQGPSGGNGRFTYGDSRQSEWGYIVVTVDRVTEYAVAAPGFEGDVQLDDESKPPVVVFAYVTGDFGFFDWDTPVEGDICNNCLDDDGDGWADELDPDCAGEEPTESTVKYCIGDNGFDTACACSDGEDNDGDGLIDGQDDDCSGPDDDIEGPDPCVDGVDNDGDGWIDSDDTECESDNGQELGLDESEYTCSNGLDDDLDGWIDASDPGCSTGTDLEDDGFTATACNDGVDNDDHGDIDALDPHCAAEGALTDSEEPVYRSQCTNGVDDDGDGYIDANDPGCEVGPNYWDEAAEPLEGFLTECADGLDNDGDTFIDADDPSCFNDVLGEPDGHLNDEAFEPAP